LDGGYGLSTETTLEETKAKQLMKLRNYKLSEREELKDFTRFIAKMTKKGKKNIIWVMRSRETVGVRFINRLIKDMETFEAEKGMIISSGQYSYAAKAKAKKNGIELIPRDFPYFNIFKHKKVPKHEILSSEERKEVLSKFRVPPHQLPWIRETDPAAIAIGAIPGDIIKIIRDSPTAGKYFAYRYVIED
jgi:DNA-directed RNA polymerase subunit H